MYSSIIFSAYTENITLSISTSGSVFSCGISSSGSHGHKNKEINTFEKINKFSNTITMISCSSTHSICLDTEGNVYAFGNHSNGRLGIKTSQSSYIPQKIQSIPFIKGVFCGYNFTILLSEERNIYSFGENNFGQLGINSTNHQITPYLLSDLHDIELVACGAHHVLCKTYDNIFYSWGHNKYGQLGKINYSEETCLIPTQCNNWPDNIISMKCGLYNSLLLCADGTVYSFGINYCGQLGVTVNTKHSQIPLKVIPLSDIRKIECGYDHCMCIDFFNNFWVFGYNATGQLGTGNITHLYKPIKHPTLVDIIDMSAGGNTTFVKTIDNTIYGFGDNQYSQLGIQTSEKSQLTPIQVLEGQEDIWCSTIGKSRAKSARK